MTGSRRFTGLPESVPAARRFVRDSLSGRYDELLDSAELMTSELAANCVLHAHTDFEVTVRAGDDVRVEVRDRSRGKPAVQSPGPEDPSGRGLRIVEAVSDAWGIVWSPRGKTVWFVLHPESQGVNETSRARATQGAATERQTDPVRVRNGKRDSPRSRGARRPPRARRATASSLCSPWMCSRAVPAAGRAG